MKSQVTHRPASITTQLTDGGVLLIAQSGRDAGGKSGRQTSASDLHYRMTLDHFIAHVEAQAHLLGEADKHAFRSLVNRLILHRAGL